MDLGIYLDMRRTPGSAASWTQHYARWIERVEEAEAKGCAAVWLSEHHFFDDGYLPQVWTLAAAIAARTQAIRIGTAVALLPLHSAVETAEQVAIADIISGGRMQPGFGVGYRKPEYAAFGGDFKRRYGVFRQRIGEMRALWGEAPGAVHTITPPPVQTPMPLWGGFRGPQGAKLAGELGLGLQSIQPELLAPYLEGLEAGGHGKDKARMSGMIELFVADDPERAWAEIGPYATARWRSYNRYMYEGTRLENQADDYFAPEAMRANFLIGTADELAAKVRERTAGLPVSDLYVWADFPGAPDALVDRHIELLVTQLAPKLRA